MGGFSEGGFNEEMPAAKRPKLDEGPKLFDEAQWLHSHPGPAVFKVAVPLDNKYTEHNFVGQVLTIQVDALSETVADLKRKIGDQLLNMPANKMKLNMKNGVFLNKDTGSLASYNLMSGEQLQLGVRERGGKKK